MDHDDEKMFITGKKMIFNPKSSSFRRRLAKWRVLWKIIKWKAKHLFKEFGCKGKEENGIQLLFDFLSFII